jgi:two-component system, chemotaxis family, sensor kinase Cph1
VECEVALERALANLRIALEESGAEVTYDALPAVMGDMLQLGQLFQNLIGNAVKFHKDDEPPRIHISVEKKNNEWHFSLKDDGIGFEQEYADRIFVIFKRLNRDEEKYPGTGIGLALCKKIVERHGGRMWAESQVGVGSTFHFTIPFRSLRKE